MLRTIIIGTALAVALGGAAMARTPPPPAALAQTPAVAQATELLLAHGRHGPGRKLGHYKHKHKHKYKRQHGHRDRHPSRHQRYGHPPEWRRYQPPSPYYNMPPGYGSSYWPGY